MKTSSVWIENVDCFTFLKQLPDHSVDLILVDPPFGLGESSFGAKHYYRDNKMVVDNYCESPDEVSYENWVYSWVKEFDRILKTNGSVMIVSGWTHEADIQNAVRRTKKFKLVNHLIWNHDFGVYTSRKFVSSHYHILYYCKKNGTPYFNPNAYHNEEHKNNRGGSARYDDLQDVIKINRERKIGKRKNSNSLPLALVEKLIKHTTKPGDVVLDIFAGQFTTQLASLKLQRKAWGCEINPICFYAFLNLDNFNVEDMTKYTDEVDLVGYSRSPNLENQRKPLSPEERQRIVLFFNSLSGTKKSRILETAQHFKRGLWSVRRIVHEYM